MLLWQTSQDFFLDKNFGDSSSFVCWAVNRLRCGHLNLSLWMWIVFMQICFCIPIFPFEANFLSSFFFSIWPDANKAEEVSIHLCSEQFRFQIFIMSGNLISTKYHVNAWRQLLDVDMGTFRLFHLLKAFFIFTIQNLQVEDRFYNKSYIKYVIIMLINNINTWR